MNSSALTRTSLNITIVCLVGMLLILSLAGNSLSGKSMVEPIEVLYYKTVRWFSPPKTPSEVGTGRIASEVVFHDPMGIAEDDSGNVYIGDRGIHGLQGGFIWRVDPQGIGVVIAGTGQPGKAYSDIPALASDLSDVQGLSLDSHGRVYFCDSANHVVLRIEENGLLTKVAGTGEAGFNGDERLATDASLNRPFDVRLDAWDNIFIADYKNHRIRKIDRDGIIHTVAGTGKAGYSGDNGPADFAQLNGPYGIFIDEGNLLFIADSRNNVIRRVDKSGFITTIAGTGIEGYVGDGGPALESQLNTPQSLFVDRAGQIYVGDEHNWAIRLIDNNNNIFTLVGTGTRNSAKEGERGNQTTIGDQENLIVRSDGSFLFTEGDSGRVLRVNRSGIVEVFAGRINSISAPSS